MQVRSVLKRIVGASDLQYHRVRQINSVVAGVRMYICLCNGFTDRDVRKSIRGDDSVSDIYKSLGCAPRCGKCVPIIRDMLKADCVSGMTGALA